MPRLDQVFGGSTEVDTLLGYPSWDGPGRAGARVVVLGVPTATPYAAFGPYAATAPAAIRSAMAALAPLAGHHDFDLDRSPAAIPGVFDGGDLSVDATDFAANRSLIQARVGQVLAAGARPLVLGGDDSVPIPVWQAYADSGPWTLLHVDAHLDFRDAVQGERFGLSSHVRRASELPWIQRIVQVGLRGLGSARQQELDAARHRGNRLFTARELHRSGLEPVLAAMPAGCRVLVSLDCDGLDPTVMPAVMAPSPGGLGYWDVVDLLRRVAEHCIVGGVCLTEFVPERDRDGLGALTAGRIALNAIDLLSRGRDPEA